MISKKILFRLVKFIDVGMFIFVVFFGIAGATVICFSALVGLIFGHGARYWESLGLWSLLFLAVLIAANYLKKFVHYIYNKRLIPYFCSIITDVQDEKIYLIVLDAISKGYVSQKELKQKINYLVEYLVYHGKLWYVSKTVEYAMSEKNKVNNKAELWQEAYDFVKKETAKFGDVGICEFCKEKPADPKHGIELRYGVMVDKKFDHKHEIAGYTTEITSTYQIMPTPIYIPKCHMCRPKPRSYEYTQRAIKAIKVAPSTFYMNDCLFALFYRKGASWEKCCDDYKLENGKFDEKYRALPLDF